jgi:hypothetical protein
MGSRLGLSKQNSGYKAVDRLYQTGGRLSMNLAKILMFIRFLPVFPAGGKNVLDN